MEAFTTTEASYISSSIHSSSDDSFSWTNAYSYNSSVRISCFNLPPLENISVAMKLYPPGTIEKMISLCGDIRLAKQVPFWLAIVTGLPGNILALLTMLQFPRTTATFYMALLAVSDWFALLMKAINIAMNTFRTSETWSCKLVLTLANFTAIYANWVLVLICFERLVTILFPLKKGYYFTLRRAHLSAVVLAFIMFLFNSVHLWVTVKGQTHCDSLDRNFSHKWGYVDATLYSYLPSILMIIMVLIIWRELKKIQSNRRSIFCGDDGEGANALTEQRLRDQAKMESSITNMLLFASVTFLLLTVPFCVVLTVRYNIDLVMPNIKSLSLELAYQITAGMVQLSHALNFFIYFVSTKRFRTHLLKLLKCSRMRQKFRSQDKTDNTLEEQL